MQRKTSQLPNGIIEQDIRDNELKKRKIKSMMANYNSVENRVLSK